MTDTHPFTDDEIAVMVSLIATRLPSDGIPEMMQPVVAKCRAVAREAALMTVRDLEPKG